MKNVDKLTDTLIHIEHVLEKNIPKGYAELVREYQVRELFIGAICLIFGVILLVASLLLVRYYWKNKDVIGEGISIIILLVVIAFAIFISILIYFFISRLANGLSPNLNMLKMLLHK